MADVNELHHVVQHLFCYSGLKLDRVIYSLSFERQTSALVNWDSNRCFIKRLFRASHTCKLIYSYNRAVNGCDVPAYRSSPHHGKLAQGGPRDDGFRSGMSVLSTYASESPAE